MLTKLEVDGFKNLLGFEAQFGPFTCIAGPNASGKSNLFDAIQFLSLLADHKIVEAAQRVRSRSGRAGDPRELFWTDGKARAVRMRFAAEMIVPRSVVDDFGREAKATMTFVRYELELGYEPPVGLSNLGRIVLQREELKHIKKGDSHEHLPWKHSARMFRNKVIAGRRVGSAFISTTRRDGEPPVIQVHQDGPSRGRPQKASPAAAPSTIVGTTTTTATPTILAVRREMQSWRMLALEPAAMRGPDDFVAAPQITPDGGNLARTLFQIATDGGPRVEQTYARVARQLSALIGARDVRVVRDDQRQTLTLEVQDESGAYIPARSLSDGTLRFLVLCVLGIDPRVQGLLCLEEPENGIHPERVGAMADLVRGLAVDPNLEADDDNPMRQVIVNTHSPLFMACQNDDDLLFSQIASIAREGRPARALRLRPIDGSWRSTSEGRRGVSRQMIHNYLSIPTGAQMKFTGT